MLRNSELVDNLIATAGEQILRDFKADMWNTRCDSPLKGKFKSAVPDGPPSEDRAWHLPSDHVSSATGSKRSARHYRTARWRGVLVADTDILTIGMRASANMMGRRMVQPLNGKS